MRRGETLARTLEALAVFLTWLARRGLCLWQAWPQDLGAYRRALRARKTAARRFDAVRSLYRFLYCRRLLRHDPGAVLELPPRPRGARHV